MATSNSANIKILVDLAANTAKAMQDMQTFTASAGKELDKLWARKTDSQVFKSMLVAIKQVEMAVQTLNTTMSTKMNSLGGAIDNTTQKTKNLKNEIESIDGSKSTATVDVKVNLPSKSGDLSKFSAEQIKDYVANQTDIAKGNEKSQIAHIIADAEQKNKLENDLAKDKAANKKRIDKEQQDLSNSLFASSVSERESQTKKLDDLAKKAEAESDRRSNDKFQTERARATGEQNERARQKKLKDDELKEEIKRQGIAWSEKDAIEKSIDRNNKKKERQQALEEYNNDKAYRKHLAAQAKRDQIADLKTGQGANVSIYGPKQVDALLMGGDKSTLEQMKNFYEAQEKAAKIKEKSDPKKTWSIEDEFSAASFGKATSRLLRYYASFAAIQGTIGTISDLEKQVYQIQEGMIGIEKYISPLSTMAPLWANVTQQAGKFGVEITGVISAYETFAQQGLRSNQIIEATAAALLSANVSGTNFKESVTFITTATRVYGEEVSQATKYVDMLAAVQAKSSVNADQMIQAFQRSGAQAKQAGISMSFLLGMYAAITEKTQQSGEMTGTGVRTITERLQRQSTIKALSGIGPLSDIAFSNQAGDLTSAEVILKKLAERWSSLTEAQQKYVSYTVSGGRQINTFLALMSNFDMVLEQNQNALNSFGFASAANEKEMQKLSKQLMVLKDSAVNAFMIFEGPGYYALTAFVKMLNQTGLGFGIMIAGLTALTAYMGYFIAKITFGLAAVKMFAVEMAAWATISLAALSPLQLIGIAVGSIISVGAGWSVLNSYFGESARQAAALSEELGKVADKMQEAISLGNKAESMKLFKEFATSASESEKQAMLDLGATMIKGGGKTNIAITEENMKLFTQNFGKSGTSTNTDVLALFRQNKNLFAEVAAYSRTVSEDRSAPTVFTKRYWQDWTPKQSPEGLMPSLYQNTTERLSSEQFNAKFKSTFSEQTISKLYDEIEKAPQKFIATLSSMLNPEAAKSVGKVQNDLDEMMYGYISQAKAQVIEKSHSWKRRTFTNFDEGMETYRETINIGDDLRKKQAKLSVEREGALGNVEELAKIDAEMIKLAQSIEQVDRAATLVLYRLSEQGIAMAKWAANADEQVVKLWENLQRIIGSAGKTWDFKFNFIAFMTDLLPGWFKGIIGGGFFKNVVDGLGIGAFDPKKEQAKIVQDELGMTSQIGKSMTQIEKAMVREKDRYSKLSKDQKQAQLSEYNKTMQTYEQSLDSYAKRQKEIDARIIDPNERKKVADAKDLAIRNARLSGQNEAESLRESKGGGAGKDAKRDATERIRLLENELEVTRSLRNEWLKFDTQTKFSAKWKAEINDLLQKSKELRDIAKIKDLPEEEKKRRMSEATVLEARAKDMQGRMAEVNKIEAAQQRQKLFFKDEEEKLRNKLSLQQEYAKITFSMKYAPSIREEGAFEYQQQQEKISSEEAILALKKQAAYEDAQNADQLHQQTTEKYNQIALENEAVMAQQRVVDKERERLGLINAQTEAKIRQKANQGVSEVQGIIGGALFDMVSLKGKERQKEQVRSAMKEIAKLQAEAGSASYGVAEAETSGSIDKINAAREKWSQVNQQLKEAQDKMNDINNKTNKWKEVLQNIGDVIIKKITEKFAEMLMKNTGLDNILGSMFGGIEGIGSGGSRSGAAAGGGLLSMFMGSGSKAFAGLPALAQNGLSMAGGFLNTASNGSLGNIISAFTGGGAPAAASSGSGLFGGGGIGSYLAPAAIGFGLGSTQKSKGAGALAGAVGGFMSGGVPGAIIGAIAGLFGADDEEEKPVEPAREFYPLTANTQSLDRNTAALQKLSEGVFGAPSVFNMNKLQSEANSPKVVIQSLTINAAGASAKAIANEISNIGAAYSQSVSKMSTVSSNWG